MSMITDEQVRQFHEQGFFITEPMWSAAELRDVIGEFHRLHNQAITQAEATGDQKLIEMTRLRPFIGAAHSKSELLTKFIKSPIYLEACAKFVGPDANLYYNQVVMKAPEKGRSFAWHQDSGYVVTDPVEYITCWTAIGPATLDNGCVWVIPGSHRLGLLPHERDEVTGEKIPKGIDDSAAIPVEVPAGTVVIFSSLTLHRSGANTSREFRYAYVPQYHTPRMVRADTRTPWGDQYPVLRGGKKVE
ncbi:MAG: phytanoyl-CoA dioxygenase family protein [Phycisphaeraceae bacterium]|nr:phytanoyl-CoA dioxygenase family protein [Phycisphaeraceae bacterium]